MSIVKEARKRANAQIEKLPNFTKPQIEKLCRILRISVNYRAKGGKLKKHHKADLEKKIRSVVGQGTFPDTLNRFSDQADEFIRND